MRLRNRAAAQAGRCAITGPAARCVASVGRVSEPPTPGHFDRSLQLAGLPDLHESIWFGSGWVESSSGESPAPDVGIRTAKTELSIEKFLKELNLRSLIRSPYSRRS